MGKRIFTLSLVAALFLAASASAATPSRSLVWAKATVAYTAQARAHGLTANCTPWNRIVAMHCDLQRGDQLVGSMIASFYPRECRLSLIFTATRSLGHHAEVNYCAPRWWTRLALPSLR